LRERDLVAVTINAIIGAGIFGLPGRLFALTGTWSLVACAACAVFALLVVLCFAEVGSRFRDTGGPYLYARATFGPAIGFQVGWLMWLSRVSAFAANANLLLSYLGAFGIPVQAGSNRVIAVVLLVLSLALVNGLGIRNAALANHIFTLGKLVPIAFFCLLGLFAIAPQRLVLGPPPSVGSFSTAVLLLVYAFTGFEMAAVPGGEMRDPQRSLPRALLMAIAAVTVVYLAIDAVCIGVLPELGASTRPLADASQRFLGPAGMALITAGIATSILGNLHITILAASRLPFAMAEGGQMPRVLAHTNPRFRSPDVAIAATATVMLAMTLLGDFMGAVAISTVARLLVYASTCAALPILRSRQREGNAPFVIPGGVVISAIVLPATVWLLLHAPIQEMKSLAGAAVVGSVIYLVSVRRTSSQ
jgi:APA family basic amino acid/polyamine antiporter